MRCNALPPGGRVRFFFFPPCRLILASILLRTRRLPWFGRRICLGFFRFRRIRLARRLLRSRQTARLLEHFLALRRPAAGRVRRGIAPTLDHWLLHGG